MSFIESIKTCLSGYANFKGRASRPEFWWFMLFCALVSLLTSLISEGFSGLATLALVIPAVAVAARRLHDIGRSGWWQLVSLVPFVGTLVVLYWYVQPSTNEPNPYDPAQQPRVVI